MNIDFLIPMHHRSIITSSGSLYLIGGAVDNEIQGVSKSD